MKYNTIKRYKNEGFRRLTGVKRSTLKQAEEKTKAAGGKPNTLTMEDRLLMCLEYLNQAS